MPNTKKGLAKFEGRKRDHLKLALDPRNQTAALSRFNRFRFEHEALPESEFQEDSSLILPEEDRFRFPKLKTPFFISGMTAGVTEAQKINNTLAERAADRGWILGLGSQRRDFEAYSGKGRLRQESPDQWERLKMRHPGLVLLGNIGLSQWVLAKPEKRKAWLKAIAPFLDGFCIHLNALQEVIQQEGTPSFQRGVEVLHETLADVPSKYLVVKETGCGIGTRTWAKLAPLYGQGLWAVDVSGAGGTHWGRIEGKRSKSGSLHFENAVTFQDWGVSTDQSLRLAPAGVRKSQEIWASGGIRSGLDAAKCFALGARRVGFAKPCLEAALKGAKALDFKMAQFERELRISLWLTGSQNVIDLRQVPLIQTGNPEGAFDGR